MTYPGGTVVYCVGGGLWFSVVYLSKSFRGIAANDGHRLEPAANICFCCSLDEVRHILVKMQPLPQLAGWGSLNPLLWNYSSGIGRMRFVEGRGSVVCIQVWFAFTSHSLPVCMGHQHLIRPIEKLIPPLLRISCGYLAVDPEKYSGSLCWSKLKSLLGVHLWYNYQIDI